MEELINTLDNWTIVKIFGGLTIILSSVISFIAILIRELIISKWKTKQQIEIENIKSELSQNNQIIEYLTKTRSDIYLSSSNERVNGLKTIWETMTQTKESMESLVFMSYTILTRDELINLPSTQNEAIRQAIDSFDSLRYFNENHDLVLKAQLHRPFIGFKLWSIFSAYQSFIGRLTYLIRDGLENGVVKFWIDDRNYFEQVLEKVITKKEIDELCKIELLAFHGILNYLEALALNEISEQISGKKVTESTINHALELSKMTKNTVAQQEI